MEKENLLKKLEAIEQYSLLAAKNVLTMKDVAVLTGLSMSHLYKLTCRNQIPYYKGNGGKTNYFDKKEIEAWMKGSKVLTQTEAEQQAASYIVRKEGQR